MCLCVQKFAVKLLFTKDGQSHGDESALLVQLILMSCLYSSPVTNIVQMFSCDHMCNESFCNNNHPAELFSILHYEYTP